MRPKLPKSIKFLLIAMALGTLLPFQGYFGLSYAGLAHLYFWQPITYFLSSGGSADSRLISLLFNCYLIWVFGSSIRLMKGPRTFLTLFLGGGIFAGSICALLIWFFPSATFLIGTTPAINALLMGWLMLHSKAQLRLFFAIPMSATWVILGLSGINLYIALSNGHYIFALASVLGLVFGYFYSLISMKCFSPFPSLRPFESVFNKQKQGYGSKIFDFKTGKEVVSDDLFIEACLEKITQFGKKSLTFYERWRLFRASKKVKRS